MRAGWSSRAYGLVLVTRYHDDEPGSPWTYALFVDARGTEAQRSAMADIFTGRLGGTARKQFPWVFKDAHLQGVEALEIEIDHTPGRAAGSGWAAKSRSACASPSQARTR
jgi:hypothetical protein